MGVKPILFNTEMVKAILDGRKTVTRRIIEPHLRKDEYSWNIITNAYTHEFCYIEIIDEWEEEIRRVGAPYQPGDVLYVRETFCRVGIDVDSLFFEEGDSFHYGMYIYKADGDCDIARWHPAIHMPKEAARIWLRVTEVGVERLQDITNIEAIDEGMLSYEGWQTETYKVAVITARMYGHAPPLGMNPVQRFAHLWDSTVKKSDLDRYGWEANPWVFRIEFERCEKHDCT